MNFYAVNGENQKYVIIENLNEVNIQYSHLFDVNIQCKMQYI